jgi:hypothetical protein
MIQRRKGGSADDMASSSKIAPLLSATDQQSTIDIRAQFFYDDEIILGLYSNKDIDQLKGHLVFLSGSTDIDFMLSCLLDGKTQEFLFVGNNKEGSTSVDVSAKKRRFRDARDFVYGLNGQQKKELCKFYAELYKLIIAFHTANNQSLCGYLICWYSAAKGKLNRDINDAYSPLYKAIYNFI